MPFEAINHSTKTRVATTRCVRHHMRGAVPQHLDLKLFLPFSHVVLQGCHAFLLRCVVSQVDLVEAADIFLSAMS